MVFLFIIYTIKIILIKAYKGTNEVTLLKDIKSGKKIKTIPNDDLNDLLSKLLIINPNQRISWEQYFNHKFFEQDKEKENKNGLFFNFKCQKHLKDVDSYCQNCKLNICESCLDEHKNHNTIPFNNIGLNDYEIKQIEILFQEIEKRLNKLTQLKNEIQSFFKEMKLILEKK